MVYVRANKTSEIKNKWILSSSLFRSMCKQEQKLLILDFDFDKPKVISRSQSQKLTTWFSLKSQCPTAPTPTRESFKEAR